MNAFLKRAGSALLLISLSVATFSCSVQDQGGGPTAPSIETATAITEQNVSITSTTGFAPAAPMAETATPTMASAKPIPTASPSAEPSNTPTPVPTLDAGEENELLVQLMQRDESCSPPCWWQVDLGSRLEDVDRRFRSLGLPGWNIGWSDLGDRNRMGSLRIGYSDPLDPSFYYVDVWLRLYTLQDKVAYIEVDPLRPLVDYGLTEFQRDWEPYFLRAVIAELGLPSSLYLRPITDAEPGLIDEVLLLYYPELGINVSYEFRVFRTSEGTKELCFDSANVRGLKLSLFTPEAAAQWPSYLLPPELETDESYERYLWEERTGQDITTLYRSLQEGQTPCVILQ